MLKQKRISLNFILGGEARKDSLELEKEMVLREVIYLNCLLSSYLSEWIEFWVKPLQTRNHFQAFESISSNCETTS